MNRQAIVKDENGNVVNTIILDADANPAEWGAEWEEEIDDTAERIRSLRNESLAASDWMATTDRTMTQAEIDYRQALRDLPDQEGFPTEVIWPTL